MALPAELLERGFKLFPIREGAKAPPLVANWPKLATNDRRQIAEWAEKYQGCNWGIHTEGLVVIDVDTKSQGPKSLTALQANHELPPTLVVRTPTGGVHLFYGEAEAPNGVNVLGQGLDIRSTNGYVVAPGSTTHVGDYKVLRDNPVAASPRWLTEAANKGRVTASSDVREAPEHVDQDEAYRRAMVYLRQHGVPGPGERDAGLIPLAAQLKDFGLEYEAARQLMFKWGMSHGFDWSDFTEHQFDKCIRQGYRTENEPGSKSAEVAAGALSQLDRERGAQVDPEIYTPYDVELSEILSSDYLVKHWVDRRALSLLYGRWGAGKTFTVLDMAAHVAAGRPWFGNRVRQGSVLFLGYEGASSMRRRLFAMRREYRSWDWERVPLYIRQMIDPLVIKNNGKATPGKAPGADTLNRALASIHTMTGAYPSLVVIDPLRDALGGSDSDPEYTAPYIRLAKLMRDRMGCAVLTLHHPGHGDSTRARGDSGIEAAMDSVIRVDGGLGRITSTKQRDSAKGEMFYDLVVTELGTDDDGDKVTTCLVKQVSGNPTDPALTSMQRTYLDAVKALADDEGQLKKRAVTSVGDWSSEERTAIVAALLRKKYLIEHEKGYEVGGGPVHDLFGGSDG